MSFLVHEEQLPRLYYFTDGFPFGKGEKPFIPYELEVLSRKFQVTIVAPIDKSLEKATELISPLPQNVDLLIYRYPSILRYLPYCLKFFFSSSCYIELRDLFHDGFSVARLLDSIKFYAVAEHMRIFLERCGVFSKIERCLYYSFWFSKCALLLALEHRKQKRLVFAARLNGYDLFNYRNLHGRQPFQRVKRNECKLLLFCAEAPKRYFEQTFGKQRFEGQYVLNRLGVAKQDVFTLNDREGRQKKLIVSCSNVIPLKRVDLIAKAISLLECDVEWVHFGDGPQLSSVKKLAKSLNIQATFLGTCANDAVIDFYRKHQVDCFVTASESEGGCPVSIQEALSFGIPIVTTDAGGAVEAIDGNGVCVSVNADEQALAQAIAQVLCASDEEWKSMSTRSYELWSERYNRSKNKEFLLTQLESILSAN